MIVMSYAIYFISFLPLVGISVLAFTLPVVLFAILFIWLYRNLNKPYAVNLGLITYCLATLILSTSLLLYARTGTLFEYPILLLLFVFDFTLFCACPVWILVRARKMS